MQGLKGKKVILRALEKEDLVRCHQWVNDLEVTKYLDSHLFPTSMVQEEKFYEELIQKEGKTRIFAIINTESGEHIGNIGLENIELYNRNAEIGLFIGEKQCWGEGFGTDAIITLMDFAFKHLGLHKIYLVTYEFNERGKACYLKCGFREEGVLKDHRFWDDRYWDVIFMGILEDEFKEARERLGY